MVRNQFIRCIDFKVLAPESTSSMANFYFCTTSFRMIRCGWRVLKEDQVQQSSTVIFILASWLLEIGWSTSFAEMSSESRIAPHEEWFYRDHILSEIRASRVVSDSH